VVWLRLCFVCVLIRLIMTDCVLCGDVVDGYGNNPYPLADGGKCCDSCNIDVVVTRIGNMIDAREKN
jgi:hypothetical protein